MSENNKSVYEDVQRTLTDLRSKTEEGLKDVVRTEELTRIEKHLSDRLDDLTRAQAAANTLSHRDEQADADMAMKSAVAEYFLKGEKSFDGPIRNDQVRVKADSGTAAILPAAQGNVVLPKVFNDLVDPICRKYSPIRELAKNVTGNVGFVTPIKTSVGSAGLRSEFDALTQSNAPKYDILTHNFTEINGTEALTVWADTHTGSTVDFANSVIQDVAAAMGEKEAEYFMTGQTQNSLQIAGGTYKNGLLQQTMLADATVDKYTNTFGTLAGVMTAGVLTVKPDDFINLVYCIHEKYEANLAILTSRDASKVLFTSKDSQGRYLLTVGNAQDGFAARVLGVPLRCGDHMPTVAASGTTPVAVVADFKKAMVVVDATDVRWLVDPLTDKRLIQYTGRRMTSSAIVNYNAIRALYVKQS